MIREAGPADCPRLADIFVTAWRSGYRGVVDDQVIDALDVDTWTGTFRELLRASGFRTAVWCDAGGHALGFSRFGPDPDHPGPDAGYLASLYVHPEAAGAGIGRALLAHALDELTGAGRTRHALWVFAGNIRARSLYESAGFGATGERRTDPRWGAEQVRYTRGTEGQTATPKSLAMPVNPEA